MSREKPTLGKLHLQTSKQSLPHLQFSTVQLHHCSLHGVILLDSFVNMLIRTFDGQIPDKPQNSEKIWPKAEIRHSQQTNCPAKSQQSGTPVYAIQGHTAIYFPWLKTHNSSRGPVNDIRIMLQAPMTHALQLSHLCHSDASCLNKSWANNSNLETEQSAQKNIIRQKRAKALTGARINWLEFALLNFSGKAHGVELGRKELAHKRYSTFQQVIRFILRNVGPDSLESLDLKAAT